MQEYYFRVGKYDVKAPPLKIIDIAPDDPANETALKSIITKLKQRGASQSEIFRALIDHCDLEVAYRLLGIESPEAMRARLKKRADEVGFREMRVSNREDDVEDREEELKELSQGLRMTKKTVTALIGQTSEHLGISPILQEIVDVIDETKLPSEPEEEDPAFGPR